MPLKPGQNYYKQFTTANPSTGAAANADALPTATANRNGTDDGAFTLTVTNVNTGKYTISGTVPSGYVKGDVINVSVAATCSGTAGKAIVETFQIDTKSIGDLNDSPYNGGAVASVTGNVGGSVASVTGSVASVTAPVTVGTNTDKTGYGLTLAERDSIVADHLGTALESGESVAQTLRLIRAVLAGTATESNGTVSFKRKDGSTVALTVVHDATGNRTSSTTGSL